MVKVVLNIPRFFFDSIADIADLFVQEDELESRVTQSTLNKLQKKKDVQLGVGETRFFLKLLVRIVMRRDERAHGEGKNISSYIS